jgi:hypothetical protein
MFFFKRNRERKRRQKMFSMLQESVMDLQEEFDAACDTGMFAPQLLKKAVTQIQFLLDNMGDDSHYPGQMAVLHGLRTLFQLQKLDIDIFLKTRRTDCLLSRYYLTPRSNNQ